MINLWKPAKEVIHYYSATIKPSAAAGLRQSFFFYLTSWVFLPPAEIHIELGLMNLIDLNEKTVSVLFKIEKRNSDKRSAACRIIKSIYLKIWIHTKCIKWLLYNWSRCNNTIFYFKLFDVGLQCKFIRTTVSVQIRGRRLVKRLGFYGGGLLWFLPKNAQKNPKKGTFGSKKWWLIGISE